MRLELQVRLTLANRLRYAKLESQFVMDAPDASALGTIKIIGNAREYKASSLIHIRMAES